MRAWSMALGTAVLAVTLGACADGGSGSPEASAPDVAAPAPPAVSGPALAADSGLRVSVSGVRRPSRDIVQVDLLVVNGAAGPLDLAAEFGREGGLPQAFLFSQRGQARVFVLADGEGVAQCSVPAGTLAPGAQQSIYVRFPALLAAPHRVSLGVPGLGTIPDVDIPGVQGA